MKPLKIVFVSTMSIGFDLRIFRGIAGYARQTARQWQLRWHKDLESIAIDKVDGLIGFYLSDDLRQRIAELGIPAVYTSRRMLGCGKPCVVTDDIAIGEMAAAFALAGPYTHFAGFGSETLPFSQGRLSGFAKGLDGRECQLLPTAHGLHGGDGAGRAADMLSSLPSGTLLFAVNDNIARNLALLADQNGIGIPGDLSILGVDAEVIYSCEAPVRLSSVDPGPERIGYRAAEMLQAQMRDPDSISAEAVLEIPPLRILEAASTRRRKIEDVRMVEASHFLENNLGLPMDVAALARRYGCSRRTFEIRFHTALGAGPGEFLRRKRLELAKKLIAEGSLSVAAVAERCGYNSLSYFSSAFHHETGISPRAYQYVLGGEDASGGGPESEVFADPFLASPM